MNFKDFLTTNTLLRSLPVDFHRYFEYLPTLLLGFVVSLLLTPVIGSIARRFNILNDTEEGKMNKLNKYENSKRRINPNQVPLLGGLAVMLPLLILIIVVFGLNSSTLPLIISLSILTIIGVLDDYYNLPATVQFSFQFIASLIVAASLVDLTIVKIPFDGTIDLEWTRLFFENKLIPISLVLPGDLFLILWFMIAINAVKWMGGVDALMESNLALAFLMIFVIATRSEQVFLVVISMYLVGALSGFIFYNFPPAKIFTGSSGKSVYGFLVATLAVINGTKVAVTLMIIMLPLADFLFVLSKRASVRRPNSIKSFMTLPIQLMRMADTNHLHHKLLHIGLSVKQVLMVEVSIALVVGIIAVLSTAAYRLVIIMSLFLAILLFILAMHVLANNRLKQKEKEIEKESPESKYSY